MQKIDLTSKKKAKEVKAIRSQKKPKLPQERERKKRAAKVKTAKKVSKRVQREMQHQREREELEKRLNIKIISGNEKEKKNIFKVLTEEIKKKVPSSVVGIYEIDGSKIKTVIGEQLDDLVSEKYFSLGECAVFINPCGIIDDTEYRTRFVTRFTHYGKKYLLAVSSYYFEAFCNKSKVDTIIKILERLDCHI